jgi:hypothetical protein
VRRRGRGREVAEEAWRDSNGRMRGTRTFA